MFHSNSKSSSIISAEKKETGFILRCPPITLNPVYGPNLQKPRNFTTSCQLSSHLISNQTRQIVRTELGET